MTVIHIHDLRRFAVMMVLSSSLLLGQVTPLETRPQRGFMPNAVHLISGLDSVDTVTGNLSLTVPLATLPPGRAGHTFGVDLRYNSQIYDIQVLPRSSPAQTTVQAQVLTSGLTGGWKYGFRNIGLEIEERINVDGWNCNDDGVEADRLTRLRIGLADGSQHVLHLRGYGDELGDGYWVADGFYGIEPDGKRSVCALTSGHYPSDVVGKLTYYTSDGSYLKLELDADGTSWAQKQWTLYFPDGGRIVGRSDHAETIYDSNGNRIDIQQLCHDSACSDPYTAITDAHGRSITIDYNTTGADSSTQDVVTASAFSGSATWTVHWTSVVAGSGTLYECGAESTYCELNAGQRVVSRIDVPTSPSLYYQFGYDVGLMDHFGELNQITTPYGAQASYQYFQAGLSRQLADILWNPVASKTVSATGQDDQVSQYDFDRGQGRSLITNPDGGVQTTEFHNPENMGEWQRGLVIKITQPDGGEIRRFYKKNITWGLRSSANNNPNNPVVWKELRSVATNGTAAKTAITEFDHDKNGNVLERREYDWVNYGIQSSTTVVRRTLTSYYVNPALNDPNNPVDDPQAYWQPHRQVNWPDPLSARRLNAVKRNEIYQGSTPKAVSEFEYDDAYRNGNVTVQKRWDSTKSASVPAEGQLNTGNSVVTTRAFDSFGNLTEVYAPEVRTSLTYGAICGTTSLYPTTITQAPGSSEQRQTEYDWNCATGLMSWQIDKNNGDFTVSYQYDQVGRPTEVNEGNLRKSVTTYDDSARKITAKSDLRTFGDGALQSMTHHDPLGRTRLVRTSDGSALSTSGETDGIKVETIRRVAAGGNFEILSNPFRSTADSTMGWTCTQYDQNGRVRYVSTFGGASAPANCTSTTNRTGLAETRYESETTVSIDPASRRKDSTQDALGRLASVTEYTGGTPSTHTTTYFYDALDNLGTVVQGSQTRSFGYSSLGRLTSVYNPESNNTSYTYYDHGGLWTQTTARSITTTHTYDALQRPLTKTYTDGTPGVTYEYYLAGGNSSPQVGRLKSVSNSVGSTTYTYDALGRILTNTQAVTGNGSYPFQYTHLLNGNVNTATYPSGRVLTYVQDDAGRVTSVTGVKGAESATYISGATYAPHGAISSLPIAGATRTERWCYNSRMQPVGIRLGTSAAANCDPQSGDLLRLAFGYGTTDNNGNVRTQDIYRASAGFSSSQSYTYDGLNRLRTMAEGSTAQTYVYDRYGNRAVRSDSYIPIAAQTPNVSSDTESAVMAIFPSNRWSGGTHDSAGNQTARYGGSFVYDGENRVTSSTVGSVTTTYAYDGEGRRVKKGALVMVYDAFGKLAAEYGGTVTGAGRHYLTTDHLGSTRLVTNATGGDAKCSDYLPFGEEIPQGINSRGTCYAAFTDPRQKFTGKERDSETGLDYFGARYFSGAQGRFASPDRPLADQDPVEPQSWNLYSYVRNRPLNHVDPDGEAAWFVGAVVGAGLDVLTQVVVEGKSAREVDLGSVAVSAVAGATGAGIAGKVAKLGWKAKLAVEVIVDAGGSATQQVYRTGKVEPTAVAIDVIAGQVGGAVANKTKVAAAKGQPVEGLIQEADRKSRIAAGAEARGNHSSARRRSSQAYALREQAGAYVERRGIAAGTATSNVASTTAKELRKKKDEEKQ